MMKKTIWLFFGVAAAAASVDAASLAEARAKIGDAVADAAVLTSTMKTLSPADQVQFLADVNKAVGKMPGSSDAKAAAFLSANRAAVKAASGTGNVSALLKEVFATVPCEALTVLNERFAAELFNRAADAKRPYTDEEFMAIAKSALAGISAHNKGCDEVEEAVRDVFAILMFVRASNGRPADLTDTLLAYVPEKFRETAKKEWLAAALAEGAEKSYAPMLDALNGAVEPDIGVVVRLAGPDLQNALLADLNNGATDSSGRPAMERTGSHLRQFSDINAGFTQGGGLNHGLDRVPFNYSRKIFGTDAGTRGHGRKIGDGVVYAGENTVLHFGAGQKVVAGSENAGGSDVTISVADGGTEVVKPGETFEHGGTIVSPDGADVKVPPGTPIAPGGTPVGPEGKPVTPRGRHVEPGGYQYQQV